MSKIFVEYQIVPEHRPAYAKWMESVTAICPNLEVYEGSDQPGLFVEMWDGISHEEYMAMKELRLQQGQASAGPNSSIFTVGWGEIEWGILDEWIKGGMQKIHIWHFKKVR